MSASPRPGPDPGPAPVIAPASASYESTLAELALGDERVVVMTAENRAAIRSLPARLGPRFVDVGICEQTMIGMAAGLALCGRIPVVHALATFLTLRAFEFIRTDVGIGRLPVKLVGGVAGLLSEANGPTHQALDDLAVMRAIPGMGVFCPADEEELCRALPSVLALPGPVYIRHNPRARHVGVGAGVDVDRIEVPPGQRPFRWGRAEPLRAGSDVTILALGFLVWPSLEAARLLAGEGLSVAVWNMRTLVPIDEEAIVTAARTSRLLVTVEDHFLVGGLYQSVSEVLIRRGLGGVAVLPIGFDGRFFAPGLLADVLEHEGLTAAGLAARVSQAWAQTSRTSDGSSPEVQRSFSPPNQSLQGGRSHV